MERKKNKNLILLAFILWMIAIYPVQSQEPACFFHETYANGNLEGWESRIALMERQHASNDEMLMEALVARYGFIGYLLGEKQNARAKKILEDTEKRLEELLGKHPGNARLLAVRAGLTGFRIGLAPLRAPVLGQRNVDAWEAALKNDPGEPMGWIEKGNSLFYRPAMFGGDKAQAEAAFRKAAELLKHSSCNWISAFIQVRLYEAYKANGKKAEAESILKKLQEKPGQFRWVEKL